MKNHAADKRIEAAIEAEDWVQARDLIVAELAHAPDDHWLLTRLGTTYYEQRRYAEACKHVENARRLCPDCPLVLWDYAGVLDALGKTKEALKIYARLIKSGPHTLGETNPCGEGLAWALALLADCMFRSAVCWERLGKKKVALRWHQAFLRMRAAGSGGIYNPAEAVTRIEKLSKNAAKSANEQYGEIADGLLTVATR